MHKQSSPVPPTMSNQQRAIVVSAFTCTGKTWFAEQCPRWYHKLHQKHYTVHDMEAQDLTHTQYVEEVKRLSAEEDTIVLVGTHSSLRTALQDQGLRYVRVYPHPRQQSLKREWLDRVGRRDGDDYYSGLLEKNWDPLLQDVDRDIGEEEKLAGVKWRLQSGEYLAANVEDIIWLF